MNPFSVGQVIHGYAGGYFGGDSYYCRRVESVGLDWVVTRTVEPPLHGTGIEFVAGFSDLEGLAHVVATADHCGECP